MKSLSMYLSTITESYTRLIRYNSWKDFESDMNKLGWEHSRLNRSSETLSLSDNHLVSSKEDPRDGNSVYYGLKDGNKFLGQCNIWELEDEIEIGDFEIFEGNEHKGLGKLMFNEIEKLYKGRLCMLCYLDNNAKEFWKRMGFKETGQGKLMKKQF